MRLSGLMLLALLAVTTAAGVSCVRDEESVDAGYASIGRCLCCTLDDDCTGGKCYAENFDSHGCYNPCTVIGDGCIQRDGSDGACYYFGPQAGEFFCGPPGPKTAGEACGAATECVAGMQCMDRGGTMTCYQVCTDTCAAGTCADTGLGFGVCVATEEP